MTQPPAYTDTVIWIAEGTPFPGADYGTALAQRFTELGATVRLATLTDLANTRPGSLNVLTGGSTPVSDITGWMPEGLRAAQALIDHAATGRSHLLGVCLGSQMIAHCLAPGSVIPGESIQVGLVPMGWRGGTGPAVLPAFHYEQIDGQALASAGATIEAGTEQVPAQAFTMGARVAGVQLHPEFDSEQLRHLLSHNGELIEQHGQRVAEVLTRTSRLEAQWRPQTALAQTLARLMPTAVG